MKKHVFCILVVVALITVLVAVLYPKPQQDYLRIHIRANSNEDIDQQIKYQVRDSVVEYLTPVLAQCNDLAEAKLVIASHLDNIEHVALQVLEKNNCRYGASASLKKEAFPTRQYATLTLEKGIYHALILELGSGNGDNWWCVAFPPLCFIPANGSKNIVYKSKILDLINRYKDGKDG